MPSPLDPMGKEDLSEILPYLFVSSYQASLNLPALRAAGITHILNVMDSSKAFEGIPISVTQLLQQLPLNQKNRNRVVHAPVDTQTLIVMFIIP